MIKRIVQRFQSSAQPQLRKNVLSGMAVSAITALLMAVSYPIYIAKLGYREYGIWIGLSVIISMSQLGNLGISQALVKRVAENYERSQHIEIGRFYSTAVFTLLSVALILFSILMTFKQNVLGMLGLSSRDCLLYSGLAFGVFALSVGTFVSEVIAALLSGIGRIDLYNYSQLIAQALSVLLSVLLVSCHFGLRGLLTGQIIGYSAGLIFSFVCIWRRTAVWPLRPQYFSFTHLRILLGQGSLLLSAWALSLLFHPVIKILFAQSGHVADLPIYEISVNLSMRLRNLFESGQRALMPETSRLVSSTGFRPAVVAALLKSSMRSLAIAAAPMYLAVFAFAGPLTRLWLRHSFNPAIPGALRLFLVGTFFSLLGTPFYYALIGMGKAQMVLVANAIQFAVGVVGVYCILRFSGYQLEQMLGISDVALALSTLTLAVTMKSVLRDFRVNLPLADPVAA